MPAKTTDPNAKMKQPRFPTHNDLSASSRSAVIELLNASLAACFDLMSQAKQAHWNVKGKEFYALHLLFDELAGELGEYVDDLAERTTALGGYATGTVRMAASASILPEYPTAAIDGVEHVAALVERYAAFGAHVREAIDKCADEHGDQASADLYTEISRGIDKRMWFLEAHIQDREV